MRRLCLSVESGNDTFDSSGCVSPVGRYECHGKCCQKTSTKYTKKFDPELSTRQFGVELSHLTNTERTVPPVVEKFINYIEIHGLYTEGIYRKSGSTNKMKELKQGLNTDVDCMILDDYNIHVIASVLKQWLRDLPNPLLTFELYKEFIRTMGLQDRKEMVRGVYSVIDQLSRSHLDTLQRLISHLARIAWQEETNRMSPSALAIVFAPCILRCPDTIDPLQSAQDISKTTACVELIICEQMNKYKLRLKDIDTLENAENEAKCRLTIIQRSMGKGHSQDHSYTTRSPPVSPRLPSFASPVVQQTTSDEREDSSDEVSEYQEAAMQQGKRVPTKQLESIQKEKEEVTFETLALEPRASDDETLELEASTGVPDNSENLNVDSEGTISDSSERSQLLRSSMPRKPNGKSHWRRASLDPVESCSTLYYSSSSHYQPLASFSSATTQRFRLHSKYPPRGSARGQSQAMMTSQSLYSTGIDGSPTGDHDRPYDARPQFTSRGTFNPEKGKQKLREGKQSTRHPRGRRSSDP